MNLVFLLFLVRLFPLAFTGFLSTRGKDWAGMLICALYACVATVNYIYQNLVFNAVFSTPLVFLTAWYIIKRNRRVR